MKQEVGLQVEHEVLSLAAGITYANVIDWFDATYKDLKMNVIFPKHRDDHPRQPLIVWLCGGAFYDVSMDAWVPELVDYARYGYTVASVEYRTSNKAPFPSPLVDVKSAIRYLRAHADIFCIDSDRVFVMGESAGGTMASLVGVTAGMQEWEQGDYLSESSAVKAVIDFYGMTDLELKSDVAAETVNSWAMQAFLGERFGTARAKDAGAVNYVNEHTPPFLILHGDADQTVDIAQSETMYEKLVGHGVDAEYVVIKGAIHGDDLFYQKEIKDLVHTFIQRQC